MIGKNSQEQQKLMNRLSSMVWVLLSPGAYKFEANPPESNFYYGIQAEACKAISSGLDVLYPSREDKCKLLSSLISKSGTMAMSFGFFTGVCAGRFHTPWLTVDFVFLYSRGRYSSA